MRELKFRAWQPIQPHQSVERCYVYSDNCDDLVSFFRYCGDEIIEQFTGLLDKNGKAIYEGDIVRYATSVEGGTAKISRWIGNNLYFEWINSPEAPTNADIFGCAKELEIIGTIHDAEYKELAK